MDKESKRRYELSKFIVKQWESEFKKITNLIPTKADIKCAPIKVKDAYRTYWKLKTQSLENTLAEFLNDENAKDCFNSSNETKEYDLNGSHPNPTQEDSVCFKALSDTTISDLTSNSSFSPLSQTSDEANINKSNSVKLNPSPLNFKNIINKPNEILDINKVWGQHLNRSKTNPEEDEKLKKLEKKSISFKYTEKLFKAAKFSKRNPRKPLKKAKSSGSIQENNKPNVEFLNAKNEDALSEPLLTKEEIKINENLMSSTDENQKDKEPNFNIFGEKTKIVIKSAPPSSVQAVSVLQKRFDDKLLKKRSNLCEIDKDWLDRVSKNIQLPEVKKLENVSQDSGIDISHPHSSVDTQDSKNLSDSDEDLIYDSDSESQNQSVCKLNLFEISKTTPPLMKTSLKKTEHQSANTIVTKERLSLKRSLEEPVESSTKKSRLDIYNYKESTTKPEILAPIRKSQQPKKKLSALEEKKLKDLEKKLASGKANENFVSINIQKKVFVRGKKNFTYSKYKKQKWKQMKKDSEINESGSRGKGVLKCYKCGDIGHFSKACPQAGKELIPLEDCESEDESPFPTLEEAAEIAKEAAEKAHNGKRLFTAPKLTRSKKDVTIKNLKEKNEIENEEQIQINAFNEPPEEFIDQNEDYCGSDIKPIYSLKEDGSLIDTPKEVFEALREFDHTGFLPGQEEAVMRILSGQSTLVTLSTGSGKSLCYQLPAYLYRKYYSSCITLVISPLISLMEDQVQGVEECLNIASLHTNQTEKKRSAVLADLKAGKLSVLLISPETLVSLDSGFAKSLLPALPPIAFACVDEAHCLYQWCHNFRPSYMTVTQVLKEKLGVKNLLGLTATASHSTVECILGHLGLDPYDRQGVISDTPLPDNLILSASLTKSEEQKQSALLEMLKSDKFSNCYSIIIYCTRREQCEKVASFLRTSLQRENGNNTIGRLSVHAEVYHAGLTAGRRNQVQKKFMTGKLRIVVATMAFGMGIDKNDIRGIIHYNMPSTFENYVQEVGRAGRDRKIAYCHLFLDEEKHDLGELKRHIYTNTIDRHTIRKLLQLVFTSCKCTGECPKHEVAFSIEETVSQLDLPQENISTLLAYLELDKKKWIKSLPLAYTRCKVTSYKGENHLKKISKTSPPLTMAMAMALESGQTSPKYLEFDVISLAKKINWDSGIVKRTLKNLEWTKVNDKPVKSGIMVEFSILGFRILSPGNLDDSELDEALDILHSTVVDQERHNLASLQAFYNSLRKVAYKSVKEYLDADEINRNNSLKEEIRGYFKNSNSVRNVTPDEVKLEDEETVAADIRRLISTHRSENNLTGRAIARVLHGIGSPNFPPIVWGRTRFWRLHLKEDFNLLCKLATKQLILMR